MSDIKNTLISFTWDEIIDPSYCTHRPFRPSRLDVDVRIELIKQSSEDTAWKLIHNWVSAQIVQNAISDYHFSAGEYLAYKGTLYHDWYLHIRGTLQIEVTKQLKEQYTIVDICEAYYSYTHHTKESPLEPFRDNRYHALHNGLMYAHVSGDGLRKVIVEVMYEHYPYFAMEYQHSDLCKKAMCDLIKRTPEVDFTYYAVEFTLPVKNLLTLYPYILICRYRMKELPEQDTKWLDYLRYFLQPLINMYIENFQEKIQLLSSYNVSTDTIITALCEYIDKYDYMTTDEDRAYQGEYNLYDIIECVLYCDFNKDKIRKATSSVKQIAGLMEPWHITFTKFMDKYLDELIKHTATKRYVLTKTEYTVVTHTYTVDVDLSKEPALPIDMFEVNIDDVDENIDFTEELSKYIESLPSETATQHTETYNKYARKSIKYLSGTMSSK